LTILDEALQIVERTGERWFAAELYRHKGELRLSQGHDKAAEELCRKALSTAAEQGAKLWELRAAGNLARLRRGQGRHSEARDLLAPVYGWFTEGFDTPDLKDAKALLDCIEIAPAGSASNASRATPERAPAQRFPILINDKKGNDHFVCFGSRLCENTGTQSARRKSFLILSV
jgi:hypothetical protein